MYSRRLLSLAVFMMVCGLWGCESKDYCAYSSCEFEEMSAPDADMRGDVECVRGDECPSLANAQASCSAAGECVYTCDERWAVGPGGDLKSEGCTCDKTMSSCQSDAVCGDGFKEGEEQCDQGVNNSDTQPDACRSSCEQAACGDKVVDAGEACDDGDDDNSDNCTQGCSRCGNGKIDDGETCDDGQYPPVSGDGCSATCQTEPYWYCEPGKGCELYLNAMTVVPKEFEYINGDWGGNFDVCGGNVFVSWPLFDELEGRVDIFQIDPLSFWSLTSFISPNDLNERPNVFGSIVSCGKTGWVATDSLEGGHGFVYFDDFSARSSNLVVERPNGSIKYMDMQGDVLIASDDFYNSLKVFKVVGGDVVSWNSYENMDLSPFFKSNGSISDVQSSRLGDVATNGKDIAFLNTGALYLLRGAGVAKVGPEQVVVKGNGVDERDFYGPVFIDDTGQLH